MVRLSRIWKLYIFYTILLVGGMTLAGCVLEDRLKERLNAHLKEDVLILAHVLGEAVPDTEDRNVLKGFCETYRSIARVGITLIRGDGAVLADSEEQKAVGETRLDRPEVRSALTETTGTAARFSDTLQMNMLYGAVFVKEKGMIIRLAMPMSHAETLHSDVMLIFSLALFLAPFLALVISFFVAKYRIHPDDKHAPGAWSRYL